MSGRRHFAAFSGTPCWRLGCHTVLFSKGGQSCDQAMRRALNAALPRLHVADRGLLDPYDIADLRLRKASLAKA